MEHPAFSEAGSNPGIEIWGIEAFEPVAVDTKMYGKFFNGDSYIVLKTTGDANSTYSYDAHFWLGSKTSQDKKGAAAILTVTLDDMLDGRAVHHREVQGHESSRFLGYFQPAIRYLEGGSESGFNQVETNAGAEKRLLKLSGDSHMRIEEVPAEGSSLNSSHCFILEVDHDIFVLMPEGAKATQRRKIISVANKLRDEEHNGRATIEIIDDFSSDEDWEKFFEALGSGSRDSLADDEDSQTYSREDVSAVFLYRVLAGDELELISLSKPYQQSQLSSAEVYILDTPCSGVYVWLGKEVDAEVKKNYNDLVQQYFKLKGYPDWVQVTRESEARECSNFKQYFHKWDTVAAGKTSKTIDVDAGYFSSDADESAAVAKKIGRSAAARGFMPDSGNGNLSVTRIVGGEQEDLTEKFQSGPAILYDSEAYVVKYDYTDGNGEDASVIYVWIGSRATADDKAAAKKLASELEGDASVVKVAQGKETKHFLSIFKGALCILYGSKDNDYKPENFRGSYDEDHVRLFRVEGTEPGVDMRAVQVKEESAMLVDNEVFIVDDEDKVHLWIGREADPIESKAAESFVETLVKEKEVEIVYQSEETLGFWENLGGVPEDKEDNSSSRWKEAASRRLTADSSLTAVSVSIAGKVKLEEISPDFTQQDLSDDGVYILDTGEELYIWQGKNTPERVKAARENILTKYIEDDGLERTVDSAISVVVKQGKEPAIFKKLFPEWDDGMWDPKSDLDDVADLADRVNDIAVSPGQVASVTAGAHTSSSLENKNQVSYEDIKNEAKAANSK